jgi:hypothetical protein
VIKSNIALKSKKQQIQTQNNDSDEESNNQHAEKIISDEQAAEFFDALKQQNERDKDKPRKTWSDDEYSLLLWAVDQYCTRQNTKPKMLTKNDWVQISGFLPGRNDF